MPRVVASIEARMGSTRLPGKVMADVEGLPAISRLVERLGRAETLDDVVLATSTNPADDVLAAWAATYGVACHRGSETDVLARVLGAHGQMESDIVVEICGDQPLIDPAIVDAAVALFLKGDAAVVTTTRKRFFPDGLDVQVFRRADLADIGAKINDAYVREHVSPYFYRHPERYRIVDLVGDDALKRPRLRLVLDYAEDLELIRVIFERMLAGRGAYFTTADVIKLVDADAMVAALARAAKERAGK